MGLYAISDLHLALSSDKPMDIFGKQWYKHDEKIKENWLKSIGENDTVLIAGDISWSMKMEEGIKDLEWVHNLPGKKVLVKGNHDYWWSSITKLNKLYDDMFFIQNNFFSYEDYAVCGTRGWILPSSENFTIHDEKIYAREVIRLKLSLDEAYKAGYRKFIVITHYPASNENMEDTEFTKIFERYSVDIVIYGHLHGPVLKNIKNYNKNGVSYIMTSCDFIDFNPIKLL